MLCATPSSLQPGRASTSFRAAPRSDRSAPAPRRAVATNRLRSAVTASAGARARARHERARRTRRGRSVVAAVARVAGVPLERAVDDRRLGLGSTMPLQRGVDDVGRPALDVGVEPRPGRCSRKSGPVRRWSSAEPPRGGDRGRRGAARRGRAARGRSRSGPLAHSMRAEATSTSRIGAPHAARVGHAAGGVDDRLPEGVGRRAEREGRVGVQALDRPRVPHAADAEVARPRAQARWPRGGRRRRTRAPSGSSAIRCASASTPPSASSRPTARTSPGQVSQNVVGNGAPAGVTGACCTATGQPSPQRATTRSNGSGARPSWRATRSRSLAEVGARRKGTAAGRRREALRDAAPHRPAVLLVALGALFVAARAQLPRLPGQPGAGPRRPACRRSRSRTR